MKLAIVGSRSFNNSMLMIENLHLFIVAYEKLWDKQIEIISGGAKGADQMAIKNAKIMGLKYTEFLPDWEKYGKSAGFIRNQLIIDNCDMVLAFWDGESRGTADTIEKAKKAKKPTFIVYV